MRATVEKKRWTKLKHWTIRTRMKTDKTNLQMEVRVQAICTEARGKIMFNAIKHLEFRVLVGG